MILTIVSEASRGARWTSVNYDGWKLGIFRVLVGVLFVLVVFELALIFSAKPAATIHISERFYALLTRNPVSAEKPASTGLIQSIALIHKLKSHVKQTVHKRKNHS